MHLTAIFLFIIASAEVITVAGAPQANEQSLHSADSTLSQSDWPMFRHDVRHSGLSPSTAPNTNSVAWRFAVHEQFRQSVWLMSPTIANGRVYVGTKGPPGSLMAIDEFAGKLLWTFSPTGRATFRSSSVAVSQGMIFFGTWDTNSTGHAIGPVYALNETDGSLIWKFTASDWVSSSPAVAAGKVFIGSLDGTFYAIDQHTGELRWKFRANGGVVSSPAVADGIVFVGGGPNLHALDQPTGSLLWKFTINVSRIKSSPAVSGGTVYVGPDDGNVYAIDQLTGNVVWKAGTAPPTDENFELISSPALAFGKLYVCSWDRALYAFDISNGALNWKTPGVCWTDTSPTVANNKVLAIAGKLVALDASNGAILWEGRGRHWVSPTVADGMVFTAGTEIVAYGADALVKFFELDWADYDNDARVGILDVASAALVFDRNSTYWDLNLSGNTDITDIVRIATLFDRSFSQQFYLGKGQSAGRMDPSWKNICDSLPEPHKTYCQTRI